MTANKAAGQTPDSAGSPRRALIGRVVDSTNSPLADVEVVLTREGDSLVVAVGTTDSQGLVRVAWTSPGGPYAVLIRKIGYAPIREDGITIVPGTTFQRTFLLEAHSVVLPELTAKAKPPRVLARGDFLGLRIFKCGFIGFGEPDDATMRELGCRMNSDAHEARRTAREQAAEVRRAARRVTKALAKDRRPPAQDAMVVLEQAQTCDRDIPIRASWPQPDPDVDCRELLEKIPRDTLAQLGTTLAALDADSSFAVELQWLAGAERRANAARVARMVAEAEAAYAARIVKEAAMRVEVATEAERRPDSNDVFLLQNVAATCDDEAAADTPICHAILKRISRKTLACLIRD